MSEHQDGRLDRTDDADVASPSDHACAQQAAALADNCREAFERLVQTSDRDADRLTRTSLAVQNIIDGTGFKIAGVARFSDDRKTATVSFQSKTGMLEETTVLDVASAPSLETILAGLPAIVTDCAEDHYDADALLRELGCTSFYAEPMCDPGDQIAGFVFAAGDEPVRSGGLALRTFLSSVSAWLLKGETAQARGQSLDADIATASGVDLLGDTLQHIGLGIVIFDADLKVTAVNEQTYGLLDVPKSVLNVGSSMRDLTRYFRIRGDYGDEEAEEQSARLRQAVEGRQPYNFERRLADGRMIACKMLPRGSGFVVTYTDVTEIYAHERERLEHEELLSDTLRHMEQGVIVFDSDLNVVALNEQVGEMLDLGEDVLHVNSDMRDIVSLCAHRGDYGEGDPDQRAADLLSILDKGEPYTVERKFSHGRMVVCSGRPRADGGFVLTYTDVTKWRQNERELDAASELLSVALKYMDQGLIVYDANLKIEAFNEQVRSLMGVSEHTLQVGASMMTLIEVWIRQDVDDADVAMDEVQSVQSLASGGEPFSFERRLADGRAISCSGRRREREGYVLAISDVTESRRQKRELAEKTSMLEAIVQHMDQGLLAFDRQLRLLFANERAKMMLGIPRELFEPGRSFEAIIREGADRNGEKDVADDGTIEQMLTQMHGTEPFSFERKCTAKTTALVRFHPRPEGGYIVTYTDITASRRQQDELSGMAEALRQKSFQLDKIFTNLACGVAMFDADCRLVISNPKYAEIFHLDEEQCKPGISLHEINRSCIGRGLQEEDDGEWISRRTALARSREPAAFETPMLDGRIIQAVHEPLDDGGSLAVYEDVTDRANAERKLREYADDLEHQKALLQSVMDNMDQGISLVDGDLVMQTFNQRFLDLLGFPTDLFQPGDHAEKFFRYNADRNEYGPGDPDEQVRERLEVAGQFEAHVFERDRPDGSAIRVVGNPLPDRKGFVTTYTDITDLRQKSKRIKDLADGLKETNRQLDAAFNNMNQGLALWDSEYRLVVRNRRYLEIFGASEDVAVPGASLEYIRQHCANFPHDDEVNDLATRLAIADSRESVVHHLQMSDGSIVELFHEPMEDGGSLTLYMDVTDRMRAERSLREHAAKLEASNRELQEFAYVAAHDLQEPLRKIEAFGDRLRTKCGDRLGEDGQRYVGRMQASSRRLRALIDALLSYSRVTIKSAPFEPVDLNELLAGVVSDFETYIEDAGARVEFGSLPTIEADEMQLRQMIMNLLSNALKFRKDTESPVIRVDAEEGSMELASGEEVPACILTFADNGIGFENKYADRIFTIFQRLHSRAEFEGTGIGLATCRKIAERHHGSIRAEAVSGQGATFRITLPVKQDAAVWAREDAVRGD